MVLLLKLLRYWNIPRQANCKIALPANICPIVPLSLVRAGYSIKIIDIDPVHLELNWQQLSALGRDLSVVLWLRPYGRIHGPAPELRNFQLQNPQIKWIDDRCLCIPETAVPQDIFADATLWSTGFGKFVELGYGAWAHVQNCSPEEWQVLTWDEPFCPEDLQAFDHRVKEALSNELKHCPWTGDLNYLQGQIQPLDLDYVRAKAKTILAHKMAINQIYDSLIPAKFRQEKEWNMWRYQMLVPDADLLKNEIFARGFFAGRNYPSIAKGFEVQECSQAKRDHQKRINLFNDLRISPEFARDLSLCIQELSLKWGWI